MGIKTKNLDHTRWPHPNASPIIITKVNAATRYFTGAMSAVTADTALDLSNNASWPAGSPQSVSVGLAGGGDSTITVEITGEDQFRKEITETVSATASTDGVTVKAFDKVSKIMPTAKDGSGSTLNIGTTLAEISAVGLPVKLAYTRMVAGTTGYKPDDTSDILSVIESDGTVMTPDTHVRIDVANSTIYGVASSGQFTAATYCVFTNFLPGTPK